MPDFEYETEFLTQILAVSRGFRFEFGSVYRRSGFHLPEVMTARRTFRATGIHVMGTALLDLASKSSVLLDFREKMVYFTYKPGHTIAIESIGRIRVGRYPLYKIKA